MFKRKQKPKPNRYAQMRAYPLCLTGGVDGFRVAYAGGQHYDGIRDDTADRSLWADDNTPPLKEWKSPQDAHVATINAKAALLVLEWIADAAGKAR